LIVSDDYMLGDLISEEKGKITSQRVLDVEGGEPKIETTFSATGNYRGIETTATVTYSGSPRHGGAIYGEGQGVLMSKDGQEMATWTGQGIGRVTSPGKIRFAGSLFFSTSSTGKLSFLNNLVGVFEYESDESGNTSAKAWEWK
jgi:predicted outer membrane repeat protein